MVNERGTDRVIIAGPGPGGAVLAYELRARDIPVLVEALSAPEIDCRAGSYQPPAVAMLEPTTAVRLSRDVIWPVAMTVEFDACPRPERFLNIDTHFDFLRPRPGFSKPQLLL